MPSALKKYVFLAWVLGLLAAAFSGRWAVASAVAGGLFAWLLLETRRRQRFSFVADGRCREALIELGGEIQALAVSQTAPWALLVQTGPQVSLLGLQDGRQRWTRGFDGKALALAARPDGRLLWAGEDSLRLAGPDGADGAGLGFEAPLFRQSYKLLPSADGSALLLHTPWFIQAVDPDLRALGPRLRYEDAGHFMKYAVLSSNGRRLYTAGALLLDEDEGGGGAMEARWDAWDLQGGAWVNAWKRAYESYNNSHLRGLQLSQDDSLLCAELWQTRYEFQLHRPDGTVVWKREGEHPVLSPDAGLLLWESGFDGVVLARVADQAVLFKRQFEDQIRLKAVNSKGDCLIVAGRRLLILGPDGRQRWDAYFAQDPEHLGLGPQGCLVVAGRGKAACLRLPWDA
jgi:hypothetical protein